jgi:hypothetical protein
MFLVKKFIPKKKSGGRGKVKKKKRKKKRRRERKKKGQNYLDEAIMRAIPSPPSHNPSSPTP